MDKTIQTKNVEVMNFLNDGKIATQDSGKILNIENKDFLKVENFLLSIAPLINDVYFKTVCFTGSRPKGLPWKYNENCDLCLNFKANLKQLLLKLIGLGYSHFITGMAMGFDMIVAEILIDLRDRDKRAITIECAVPCLNQSEKWSASYKNRYNNLLKIADRVTYVSNQPFYNGCYQKRNNYMVDNASLVVAGIGEESKGTITTVDYAKKRNKNIIILPALFE